MTLKSPPPPYSIDDLKTSSTIQLTTHEIVQKKEKLLREKNAIRDGKLNTSDMGAFLHVVKSSMGSGFLAMPYAFHNIGLLMGFVGTALVALVCAHCTHIVVKSSQELCYIRGISCMSYTETVESAFTIGAGRRFARWAPTMRKLANVFMFVTYYGVNATYVILIASTFKHVFGSHFDMSWNIRWYVALLTILLLPIGLVRHIKFLVPFSAIANVCLLLGCSITLYLCCQDLPPISSRPLVVEMSRWPLFFSTALFGMEGIGTVMPIENAMRNPAHFLGCPGVLNFGMTIVASMFLLMGAIGYIKFGDAVEGSINLNLPQDMLSEVVKILIGVAVLLTYPLQLTASMGVAWDGVRPFFSKKNEDIGYYITRTLMILGTVLIGIAVPNLSPVLSLVGAVGFSGLGLLLPTLTEAATFWDSMGCLAITKHIVLILLWAFATVTGSITSVNEIIEQYDISH